MHDILIFGLHEKSTRCDRECLLRIMRLRNMGNFNCPARLLRLAATWLGECNETYKYLLLRQAAAEQMTRQQQLLVPIGD